MEPILPVLRPLQFRSPGDILLFKKRLKALPRNPVDAYLDWVYLPDPATIRLPFALTNQQGGDRYVQTQLSSPPSGWTDSPIQHGAVANGATLLANHVTQRAMPSFTDGEYDETITLLVRLYRDSGYTDLDLELTVEYALHHFKSDDPAWSLLAFHDFEASHEDWVYRDLSSEWGRGFYVNIGSPGYASTYSMILSAGESAGNDKLQIYSASFNSTSELIKDTLDEKIFDSGLIALSDLWLAFFGNLLLTKTYIGIVLIVKGVTYPANYESEGYSTPSATKCRFSGVVYHDSGGNKWYADRIRIVYK